jgi:hypothetical protein
MTALASALDAAMERGRRAERRRVVRVLNSVVRTHIRNAGNAEASGGDAYLAKYAAVVVNDAKRAAFTRRPLRRKA